MHGLGNDFVILDARAEPLALSPEAAAALADRRFGVGCDTVTVIEAGTDGADARLRFLNADGSNSGTCGNATRCVARLLFAETGADALTLDTGGGRLTATRAEGGLITVDMGAPRFDWADIPLAERMDTRTLELQVGPIDAPILKQPSAASMGNPHCIFFVDRIEDYDLERIGPMVEHHPLFPEGCNVSFAQLRSRNDIRLAVWERGAGRTLACGSAACATLAAAARRGLAERSATVTLDGGSLHIAWREEDGHILMTGAAEESFRGTVDIDALTEAAAARAGRRR